jgi:TrmH family RNA methyltransferase
MTTEQITSRDNRRLVEARKVRDGKVEDRIFIEGRRLVEEALLSGVVVEYLFLANGVDLPTARSGSPFPVYQLTPGLLNSISDTENSQGIIAIGYRPDTGPAAFAATPSAVPLVVFLNEINNPSNLGAVIRTDEAAGIRGVITSANSADVFSPKALRAAMGSSFRVPIWEKVAFEEALEWAKQNGLAATAADTSAERSYTQLDWKEPRLLVFGSEAHGLSASQLSMIGDVVNVPMASSVESLNLAVSAGIILFEAKRQKDLVNARR